MKYKKIISIIVVILIISVIFMFSNQDSTKSQGVSSSLIIKIAEKIKGHELDTTEKTEMISKYLYLVRKCAHFFLYFLLGISILILYKNLNIQKRLLLYAILTCLLYAISDEIHQIFIPGRTAKVIDIFIDTCGAAVGITCVYFLFLRKKLINKK